MDTKNPFGFMRTFPSLMTSSLVGVQPMNSPAGQIFNLKYDWNFDHWGSLVRTLTNDKEDNLDTSIKKEFVCSANVYEECVSMVKQLGFHLVHFNYTVYYVYFDATDLKKLELYVRLK